MGWFGNDLEAVIDLGTPQEVTSVEIRCLQITGAGIYLPREVQVAVSEDGKTFAEMGARRPKLADTVEGPEIENLTVESPEARGRWIRVRAVNIGEVPSGRPGAGTRAWLFADEIVVATGDDEARR